MTKGKGATRGLENGALCSALATGLIALTPSPNPTCEGGMIVEIEGVKALDFALDIPLKNPLSPSLFSETMPPSP